MEQKTIQQYVTKDMTMGDIVKLYPAAIEVMLANGLHCIGCHVSYWETLEQGTMGHGMTEEQMNKMIDDINKTISESIVDVKPGQELILTKKATEKLKEIISDQKKQIEGLKIRVSPGGCAGYHYDFELISSKEPEDLIIEDNGVKVLIDQESLEMIRGATIDYVDALQGAGFKVSNPQATSTCGCGQSFS